MAPKRRVFLLVALAAVLTAGLFCVDLFIPLGYTDWLYYIVPLFLIFQTGRPKYFHRMLAIIVVLIILGLFLSPSGVPTYVGIVNRSGGLLVFVMITIAAARLAKSQSALSAKIHSLAESEQALRESQEDLNRAQCVAQTGSWRLDIERNELLWSNETYRLFGIPEGMPMTYESFLGSVHPEDRDLVDRNWKEALQGKVYDIEHRIIVCEGDATNTRWVRERGELEFGKDGKLRGGFGTVQDITERKRLEQRLIDRAKELEAANSDLESFSYSVSHDLRGPLNTLKGFSDLLLEDYSNRLDETGRDYLRRIGHGVIKMSSLIDDMLKLSRVGRDEMTFQDIDLSSLALSKINELRHKEPGRGVDIIIHDGLRAKGDRKLIDIAFSNLLGNAWKFTSRKERGCIEVGEVQRNGEKVFFVRDNGAGFDMKQADKLFAPFQRLHPESDFKGTGIGLAIVDRVIRRHGGRIWAEGEPEKGAIFYFTLASAESDGTKIPEAEAMNHYVPKCGS